MLIQSQAAAVDLGAAEPVWGTEAEALIAALGQQVLELEYTLIPHGLHVVGERRLSEHERVEMLIAVAESLAWGTPRAGGRGGDRTRGRSGSARDRRHRQNAVGTRNA